MTEKIELRNRLDEVIDDLKLTFEKDMKISFDQCEREFKLAMGSFLHDIELEFKKIVEEVL